MKIITALIILFITTSSVFAYSDVGLLDKQRTISYFLLNSTDRSQLSSGLVFNQKQNEKLALEVSYTSYQSFYLYTRGITRIRISEKYKFARIGPIDFTGMGGLVLLYAPSVGGGVAADVGCIASANITDSIAVSLPLNFVKYSDGFEMDLSPNVSVRPAFKNDLEIYGGARIEAQMVGSFSSQGSQGGKVNMYLELGLRTGI